MARLTTLTFALIHLAPGDPIVTLAGDGGSAEYYQEMRAMLGNSGLVSAVSRKHRIDASAPVYDASHVPNASFD